ncbi:PD-(D/E)XK nuclease family protein [Candidatus Kaiserbacteria bacterium]|nr:PD-(D/E)XK nuclease family protein [Candidatus Kaiserbacteria bacterium]
MAGKKYDAVWVSHSSMGDFLKCPRAYYLHNVYKNPDTGRKITIVNPALSLGSAVHATLEALKTLPAEERLQRDLLADFDKEWATNATGKKGGFTSDTEESAAKARGRAMIERVIKNPGLLAKKTVKLKEPENNMPPNFYLSEKENIILCGLIDWLEYVEANDSVRIIDFKTGKNEEGDGSLQLPIYLLLLNALQKRRVSGAAYWYLEKNDAPTEVSLPDATEAREKVLALARRVKVARENRAYECPRGPSGCFACQPYEAILSGEAEYIGVAGYGQDAYLV